MREFGSRLQIPCDADGNLSIPETVILKSLGWNFQVAQRDHPEWGLETYEVRKLGSPYPVTDETGNVVGYATEWAWYSQTD